MKSQSNQALVKSQLALAENLRCRFSLQHLEGTHVAQTRGILRGRRYKVEMYTVLCEYCGNTPDSANIRDGCPALLKARV